MEKFIIKGDFITIGQFLKTHSIVSSGGMVKPFLEENDIFLNGVKENRRGKKIYVNDTLSVLGKEYLFINDWTLRIKELS